MNMFRAFSLTAVLSLALGGVAFGEDNAEKTDAAEKDDYPMAVCVVSGEPLGEMGEPAVIEHEGREIRLCCPGCEKEFRKDPAGYLKKLDDAEAAAKGQTDPTTQPATQPAEKGAGHHDHHDDHADHDDHGDHHDHADHAH